MQPTEGERNDPMPKHVSSSGLLETLTKLAGVVSIIAAYLYFTGWVYLNVYYREFGIHMGMLDLASYIFPLEAFSVLFSKWGLFLVVAIGVIALLERRKGISQTLLLWVLILLFPALYWMAREEGFHARRVAEATTLHVALSFKGGEAERSAPLLFDANQKGKLRLLAQTKDLVVVFYQPGTTGLGTDHVYILQRSDLSVIHIIAR
jgi:hypothetical protein